MAAQAPGERDLDDLLIAPVVHNAALNLIGPARHRLSEPKKASAKMRNKSRVHGRLSTAHLPLFRVNCRIGTGAATSAFSRVRHRARTDKAVDDLTAWPATPHRPA